MSIEHIGMEKALPMFILGISCIVATAVVFGVLCGHMLRERRKIEKIQQENEEKEVRYPFYIIRSQSRESLQLPTNTINNKIHNTNQSAAFLSSTTHIHAHPSSRMAINLDPTFKLHPSHLYSDKRIVQL